MIGGLALILALIGGIYWGTRYSHDKQAHAIANKQYEEAQKAEAERRRNWLDKVTNTDFERDFEERIFQRDETVIQELADSWQHYFEADYPQIIIRPKGDNRLIGESFGAATELTALRVIMANRGLLTLRDATEGIDVFAQGETAQQKAVSLSKQLFFIQTVNEQLNKHGSSENVYFEGLNLLYYPISGKLNARKGFVHEVGKVKWEPIISQAALDLSNNRLNEIGYLS